MASYGDGVRLKETAREMRGDNSCRDFGSWREFFILGLPACDLGGSNESAADCGLVGGLGALRRDTLDRAGIAVALVEIGVGVAAGNLLHPKPTGWVLLEESNCARVQSDIINRVQESRSRLEAEIRELLGEISRIAEQALTGARTARAAGASAVQTALALARLDGLEREIRDFGPTL